MRGAHYGMALSSESARNNMNKRTMGQIYGMGLSRLPGTPATDVTICETVVVGFISKTYKIK